MSGVFLAVVGASYSAAPVNTVAPAVTGTAVYGSTLTTTNGTWTGAPAPTFTYQWFRSPSTSISGATSSTYVLVVGDIGFGIYCQVTATNIVAPSGVTANSNTTATVTASVPGAPTIGTATATGATTATVTYTAPADNGGSTITLYTATSSPGGVTGTLATAGSGTITVSGLTTNTAYTFTVTDTHGLGTGAASAASNSATPFAPAGQAAYGPGTYTWVAPAGISTISLVAVGGGGARSCGGPGGGGGGLGYVNCLSVTPGNSYTVVAGPAGVKSSSSFPGTPSGFGGVQYAQGGSINVVSNGGPPRQFGGGTPLGGASGGTGGSGGCFGCGGGAAGYTGNGGPAGSSTGQSGSGGGAGGGGGGGSGGGVGLLGEGGSGAGGTSTTGAGGGSGGCVGQNGFFANGGVNGGGGRYDGGGGGVRIIWAGGTGITRQFPSTNTGNI